MKPNYEIVTAAELKVGENLVTMHFPASTFAEEPVHSIRDTGSPVVTINGIRELRKNEPVIRCVPATEDPRVLRRALVNACEEIAAARLMDAPAWAETFANDLIERAREELESKAGND